MQNLNFNRQTKNRLTYLDVSKAIAILAIIMAHLNVPGYIITGLYAFHVPIFFIISGYFFKAEDDFGTFLKKKIKGYFIPYCSAAVVIIIFRFCRKGFQLPLLKKDIIEFLFQRRFSTLWFLAALFWGMIIFWIICRLTNDNIQHILIVATVISVIFILYDTYIKIPIYWNIDIAFIIQFYLAFGYCLKKKKILDKIHAKKNKYKFGIIAVFMIIGVLTTVMNYLLCKKTFDMFSMQYGIFPLTILSSVMLSIAVITGSMLIEKSKVLSFLGRNTLIYFAFHQSIAIPIASYVISKGQNYGIAILNNYWVYLVIDFLIVMFICACMDFVIRHTPLRYLFGKK